MQKELFWVYFLLQVSQILLQHPLFSWCVHPGTGVVFPPSFPCWQTLQSLTSYSQPYRMESAFDFFHFCCSQSSLLLSGNSQATFFWSQTKPETPGIRNEWFLRQTQQSVPKIEGRDKYWGLLNILISCRCYFPLFKKSQNKTHTKIPSK